MPELGKYAVEVALSYGVTAILLIGIVTLSVVQSRKVRRSLESAEARQKNG
ncbi:heme exporter protein CcmD [Silicimonas sp. MF1-12-2]|jgi:heme exporter protein D|uniref:heme exporter protein CcmD n=1 Tax=Silicimonas sp. MF1-12-2 TaxID=3384793 RepID=UPI0039B59FD4